MKAPAPRQFAVLVLDVLLAATVISAVLGVLLPEAGAILFKTRFVEVLSAMSHERPALIEWQAHAGTWTGVAEEKLQRGYRVRTAGGTIVAAGALSGRRFAVGMRPAIARPAGDWSVLWLCGSRQPPAGWAVSAAAAPFELPDEVRLSVCRRERP